MPKRINFFHRVRKGFGNLFVSAEKKRKRAVLQHEKERKEYRATTEKLVQRFKKTDEDWTTDELRGFQETAMNEFESKTETGEMGRHGKKIIILDAKRKKDIMERLRINLKNAESFKSQGKHELAGTFYTKAARMSILMGDEQHALELENMAKELSGQITEKPKIRDIEKKHALKIEIDRRGTEIIRMDATRKKDIMERLRINLKNAEDAKSRGLLALEETCCIRAARLSRLNGNEQHASELENRAEQLKEQILKNDEA